MQNIIEHVVLVNEANEVLGTMPKSEVHGEKTPLHRAFSCFLFNSKGELLLQQRSSVKKTWPLVWSNSCCGHPELDETNTDAGKRRLKFELGMEVDKLQEVSPYRYCFTKDGVMENEICPIIIGFTDVLPSINLDEVEAVKWIKWEDFLKEIETHPENWSPWCVEETLILKDNSEFNKMLLEYKNNI